MLFTTISTGPISFSTRCAAAATSSGAVTSKAHVWTVAAGGVDDLVAAACEGVGVAAVEHDLRTRLGESVGEREADSPDSTP